MKKLLAALLALAALGWLAVAWLRSGPSSTAIAPLAVESEPAGTAPAETPPSPVPSATEPAAPAPERSAERAAREAGPEPDPVASGPRGPRIAGTIVVLDEHGIEHAEEDGQITLLRWEKRTGSGERVDVRKGRFELDLSRFPDTEALGVQSIELGGKVAAIEQEGGADEEFPVPEDGRLALRARWVADALLHVVDARDRSELAAVLLVEARSWPEEDYLHPGPSASSAAEVGASPIRIAPPEDGAMWRRTFLARSPGFAWGRVQIDPSAAGEHWLGIAPSGDVELHVEGEFGASAPELRVRDASDRMVAVYPIHGPASFSVEGLVPGEFTLRAELGDWWSDPIVLGEAKATVVAGERARVTLRLEAAKPVERVPFAGTLELPEAWGSDGFQLDFELLDVSLDGSGKRFAIQRSDLREIEGDPSRYLWSAPDSQPGRYEVELRDLGFSVVIELPPEGTRDARIAVPPPCDVEVRCVDDETGLAVIDAGVGWRAEVPEGVHGYSIVDARWDAEAGLWRFRAPAGRVLLNTSNGAYADSRNFELHDVHPGRNEIELRLERTSGLRPVLRDGETTLLWDEDHPPDLVPLEGQERFGGWSSSGGSITLYRRQPGRYTLKVEAIDGYLPVADREVVLEKGRVIELVIEVERVH